MEKDDFIAKIASDKQFRSEFAAEPIEVLDKLGLSAGEVDDIPLTVFLATPVATASVKETCTQINCTLRCQGTTGVKAGKVLGTITPSNSVATNSRVATK